MSRRAGITHVAALDGLRGVAVAGVLVFHDGHLTGGFLGVDLFFVLSGFLITSLLLAESNQNGEISLGAFWARRARRLLPALAALLVGVAVYCAVAASPADLAQIRGDALATIGYVANWRAVFARQDYWALFQTPSPLQHTWSLAIEEQFYLVWPLVFVGLLAWWKRRTAVAVLATALLGAAASTVLMAWLYNPGNTTRAYYGTDTRAAGILIGAALAAALAQWGPVHRTGARVVLEAAGVASVGFLAWAWTRVPGQASFLYRGGFLLCALAAAIVIAAATHPQRGPIARTLGVRPLCVLGLVSYGVYLWHWPVYVVLDETRTGLSDYSLLAVRLGVTFAIAAVSYLALEMPIRRGALSKYQWRVAIPALASVLLVALVASTAGARPRVNVAEAKPEPVGVALRRVAAAPPGIRRVMVVGNSVGWYLGRGFDHSGAKPAVVALNAAFPSCVFPSGITQYRGMFNGNVVTQKTTPCDTQWGVDVHQFRPDVVLFVVSPSTDEALYDGQWTNQCAPEFHRRYRADLRRAVEGLRATGAKVVLTTAGYTRFVFSDPKKDRLLDCENQIRREVARETGAQLVDLFSFTCPDGACIEKIHGVVLRPDGLHYEGRSARMVDRWIMGQLRSG
jgi:peptidoglycan/LPS O-acetylase OafA/YrhL